MKKLLFLIVLSIQLNAFATQIDDDSTPTLEIGAEVFVKRCVLCHGDSGMGEGAIPLRIKSYPDTNLVTAKKAKTQEQIHQVIAMGALLEGISQYMPPMGNELTWTELESVAMFVLQLRNDPKSQLALLASLKKNNQDEKALKRQGELIFQSRCALCHGPHGEGNGRMAKVIKNPPPFNLTKSVMPAQYLSLIIEKGGTELNRSPQMPPWGDQLNEDEINSVVEYIIGLRR